MTLRLVIPSVRVVVAFTVAAAVAGCGSRPLLDATPAPAGDGVAGSGGATGERGDDGAAGATIGVDGGSAPPATVPLPAGVMPGPYVNVAHDSGTCQGVASGTSVATASAAEVASLLVGRWQLCSSYSPGLGLAPHAGMQFARDRSWRLLVKDGDSLTPATGFDSAGRWYMSAEDPNDMVVREQSVVRILPDGAGASGYPVDFLQHPTVMRLGHTLTYVWLGE